MTAWGEASERIQQVARILTTYRALPMLRESRICPSQLKSRNGAGKPGAMYGAKKSSRASSPRGDHMGYRITRVDHHRTTTSSELPGHRIVQNLGVVRGVSARSRALPAQIAASLRTVFGGRIQEYIELCVDKPPGGV